MNMIEVKNAHDHSNHYKKRFNPNINSNFSLFAIRYSLFAIRYSVRHSIFNIQSFVIRHSSFDIRYSIFNIHSGFEGITLKS